MEDIEDIVGPTDGNLPRISAGVITPKQLKPQTEKPQQSESGQFLPGQATVFVKTWGCGHNNSDGEYMAGMLATDGYNVILEHDRADEADIWVLNSCTVKGPSQTTFENDIKKGLEKGIKVVVAGCVPQGNQLGKNWQGLSVIGVQQIDKVVHVVEETLKGNQVRLFKESKTKDEDGKKIKSGGASLNLPKIRRNPFIEIIPINTGCLNQCTYCKTKHARGDLGSYQPEEIIERVKDVLDEGVLEIWLTSEDTGAYGRDIGKNIVDLLWGIVKVMEVHPSKNAMLRVGMTNPPYILEHLDGIAAVLSHPRVYSFLHVPVQAGATEVLNDMKRLYVIEDFEKVCDVLLAKVPEMTLATDVICGFPTETEEHFEETMRILQKYRFTVLHISQFYPRPGTPAARMKRVDTLVVKERSRKATKYFNSYTSFDHLVGEIQQVFLF
jgi:threonylcarbamoyladenosine tRNA methylthiotransferase CDKAL1